MSLLKVHRKCGRCKQYFFHDIYDEGAICPHCGESIRPKKYCPSCGQEIKNEKNSN